MADDLDRELARLFRPVSPPPGGLAAVKRRGDHLRRRRALAGAAGATAAIALIAGLAVGTAQNGARHTDVQVGTDRGGSPATPGGSVASGGSVAPASNASVGATSVVTSPPAGTVEPGSFVAESSSEHVVVVDSQSGQMIRGLTPGAHDVFGTLSGDGQTFYLQTPARLEANCPSGFCAINVASGATSAVARFQWGHVKPSATGTPISPDGTHAVSTNWPTNSSPTVTLATSTGEPITYQVPSGYQVYASPLWSSDGQYLSVADVRGVSRQQTAEPVIMNAATGVMSVLEPPAGCSIEPMALSDTELFAAEDCPSTGADLIARYVLATGVAETPIGFPPGSVSLIALATDPSGQHLIVAATEPGGGNTGRVWTEQGGTWTEVPDVEASALAW